MEHVFNINLVGLPCADFDKRLIGIGYIHKQKKVAPVGVYRRGVVLSQLDDKLVPVGNLCNLADRDIREVQIDEFVVREYTSQVRNKVLLGVAGVLNGLLSFSWEFLPILGLCITFVLEYLTHYNLRIIGEYALDIIEPLKSVCSLVVLEELEQNLTYIATPACRTTVED